jgi:predicted metal-dependent phosphoesterase TrpH
VTPRVDLHAHTNASDGALTPAGLVNLARSVGLEVLAVTDHDTVNGVALAQAAALGTGLDVWAGVEISADVPSTEVHILGYFVEPTDSDLLAVLDRLRAGRIDRALGIVGRLAELGIRISYDRVVQLAGGGAVGRPHIAQAMLEAGYVADFRDAFDRFLGRNGPAYVERYKLTPAEAVSLIRRSGGLAVMAHPGYIGAESGSATSRYADFLPEMLAAGLGGIEAYYPGFPPEFTREIVAVAEANGLIPTGGTDFHSHENSRCQLGDTLVPWTTVEAMRAWRDHRTAPA